MKIQRAYKVELDPNNKQKTLLAKSVGTARFAYNWGLETCINVYKTEKKTLSGYDLGKILNAQKKEKFPWMYEVSKCAPQEALKDVEKAYQNFFRGIKSGQKIGFPKFKSKHRSKNSFRIDCVYSPITNSVIHIPKIGKIRLKEKGYIPTENVHYNSVTISKQADRWFSSVQCEVEIPDKPETLPQVLGIDMGIKTLATCSDGQNFENNKYLRKSEKKLAHAQRNLSRKKKDSQNFKKSKLRVQKIHLHVANQRKDSIHKMTSTLVRTKPQYFALEDLNVQGMVKNHSLARSLSDASFWEVKRQMLYKTFWYGGEVLEIDRFFPSSKKCSVCGNVKTNLSLSERIYACGACGHTEDRDLNASKNLEAYGLSTLSSRGIQACGESVRPTGAFGPRAVSVNQEENKSSRQEVVVGAL